MGLKIVINNNGASFQNLHKMWMLPVDTLNDNINRLIVGKCIKKNWIKAKYLKKHAIYL